MQNKQRLMLEQAINKCQALINGTVHLPFNAPNSLREALDTARKHQQNDLVFQQAKRDYEASSSANRSKAEQVRKTWERGQQAIESEQRAVDHAFKRHPTGLALDAAEKSYAQATSAQETLRVKRREADWGIEVIRDEIRMPLLAVASRSLPGDPGNGSWPAVLAVAREYDRRKPFKALRGWWIANTQPSLNKVIEKSRTLLDVHIQQEANRELVKNTALAVEQARVAVADYRLSPEGRALLDPLEQKKLAWNRAKQPLEQEISDYNTKASDALRQWENALQSQWQTPAFGQLLQAWLTHQNPKAANRARNNPSSNSYRSNTLSETQVQGDWLLTAAIMANVMDASGSPTPGGGMDWSGGGGHSGGGGASGSWDSSPSPSPSADSDYSSSSGSSSSYSMD